MLDDLICGRAASGLFAGDAGHNARPLICQFRSFRSFWIGRGDRLLTTTNAGLPATDRFMS
jgi:hypothetical protein